MFSQMNGSNEAWCLSEKPDWDQWCIIGAVLTLAGIIQGLVGSALVIVAVTTRKELKLAKNILVTFLTIPDVFMLTVLYSANVDAYIHKRWRYGVVMCKVWPILAALFVSSSMMLQTTIAVQKYVAFFYKQKFLYSKRTIAPALLVSWAFPAIVFANDFKAALTDTNSDTVPCFSCIYYNEITNFVKLTVAIGFVLVPSITCALCYLSILSAVRSSRRLGTDVLPQEANTITRDWIRRDLELTKMFAVSLMIMMIGYMPFSALQVFDSHHTVAGVYYMLFASLHCFATGSNVWLYGIMHKDFRAAYRDAFRYLMCRFYSNGRANERIVIRPKPETNNIIVVMPNVVPSNGTSTVSTNESTDV